jgi:hypothetical protein
MLLLALKRQDFVKKNVVIEKTGTNGLDPEQTGTAISHYGSTTLQVSPMFVTEIKL